jgi:protein dithiol:quinone oxidoreductase
MMKFITPRILNLVSFIICCGLIAFAYYLEIILNLQPCPLCVLERLVLVALAILFLLASIHNPDARGQKLYGSIVLLLGFAGMVLAGRHLWLQGQTNNALGEICIPGISYLLKSLPLTQAVKTIFLGSSDCAKIDWTFLGLSIPGWSFLFFDIFALLGLGFIKGVFSKFPYIHQET